jgi:hypothetical protein
MAGERRHQPGGDEADAMIYPNTVLETIQGMPKSFFFEGFSAMLKPLVAAMRQSVSFNFGSVEPSKEHYDFACDMFERGLFTLPFEFTSFSFLKEQDGQRIPGMMTIACTDGKMWGFACAPQPDGAGRFVGGIPTLCGMNMRVKSHLADKNAEVELDAYPLVAEDVAAQMWGKDERQRWDTIQQRMGSMMLRGMAYTVMLMSKGVETALSPAPTKLNDARAKKGKPPIGDRYVVTIQLEHARRIFQDDGSEIDITGHLRKSPRAHWRRGHFRTLNTGIVIPVAPAVINAGEFRIPKPTYQLPTRMLHS